MPDEPPVYDGFPSGRAVLVDAATLDEALVSRGFEIEVASETVTKPREIGQRVTVNALYRKL